METIQLDILSIERGIIVHGCNAQGVMGAGLAKKIANKYPQVFDVYLKHCRVLNKDQLLGTISVAEITTELLIVNGITQFRYGRDRSVRYTDYDAVRDVFIEVNDLALTTKLPVYFPMIGCGLGNGDWPIIKEIIDEQLETSILRYLCLLQSSMPG